MFKRTLATLGLVSVLGAAGAAQAASVQPVPVFVNADRLRSDALLIKGAGRTVLPMRVLFEALGAQVEWDPTQRAVYAWHDDGRGVRIPVGGKSAQTLEMSETPGRGDWGRVVDTYRLDAPAMMIDGRVFVPVRFAAEALRADVRFASYEPAVHIRTEAIAGSSQEQVERPLPVESPEQVIDLTPAQIVRSLDVSMGVKDRDFRPGEPVKMSLVVRNTGNRTLVIPFNSEQKFDFEVWQENKRIWNWANDHAFGQARSALTLKPGEEVVYKVNWDQTSNEGRRQTAGRYTVRGILTSAFDAPELISEQVITLRR